MTLAVATAFQSHRSGTWLAIGTRAMIADPSITDAAKITAMMLSTFIDQSGWCFPAVRTLAAIRNQSVRTTQNHLRELERAGHIRVRARHGKDGAQRSSLYQVVLDAPPPDGSEAASISDTPDEPGADDTPDMMEGGAENDTPPPQTACPPPVQTGCTHNLERGTQNAISRCALPKGWQPDEAGLAFAREAGVNADIQLGKFRTYWQGKGALKRPQDWQACWRTWIANEHQRMAERGHTKPLPDWSDIKARLKAKPEGQWWKGSEVQARVRVLMATYDHGDPIPHEGEPLLGPQMTEWNPKEWLRAADAAIHKLHAIAPGRYGQAALL